MQFAKSFKVSYIGASQLLFEANVFITINLYKKKLKIRDIKLLSQIPYLIIYREEFKPMSSDF